VVDAFQRATDVRLEQEDRRAFEQRMAQHPVGLLLPRVENYSSPEHANDRFDGRFTIRIYLDGGYRDEGVKEDGLEVNVPERGPQGHHVAASAQRANVEVMFWSDHDEVTPAAEATWSLLRSCLTGL
jgi:hypothetical protein